jgi:hypothetical protein
MAETPNQLPVRIARGAALILASSLALAPVPAAAAQEYELVPPEGFAPAEQGISARVQVDVIYTPPGATAPVLIQRAFETRSSGPNLSSDYVFSVINDATLAGIEHAIGGGAQTGRVSVVAVCYAYGLDGAGQQSVAPMGVFINTSDLNVLADGKASVQSRYKIVPPGR